MKEHTDNPLGEDDEGLDVVLREEQLTTGTEQHELGRVRAAKTVETEPYREGVTREVEHADVERTEVLEGDSGEVETLPDGSISIPVFEEEIVITKRLVVRERVIVRKRTVVEEHVVTADLRRERLDISTTGDVELS
jgi:uncharacterized protein (TIGR02271 family)